MMTPIPFHPPAFAPRQRPLPQPPPRFQGEARPHGGDALALTPREREVLELIAEGKNNRQIAEALGISAATAKNHAAAAVQKMTPDMEASKALNAHRRHMAALRAMPGGQGRSWLA